MRWTVLLERDEQLARCATALAECAPDRSTSVLVTGGIGCGKSELLRTFAEHAQRDGAAVFHTAGRTELTQSMLAHVTGKPRYDTPEQVCSLLRALAGERALVVLVDDAHLLRDSALAVLRCLRRRTPHTPTMLVIAERSHPGRSQIETRAELKRHTGFQRVRIGPLSPNGSATLLQHLLDAPDDADRLAEYHALSGGNPRLLHALAEDDATAPPERGKRTKAGIGFQHVLLDMLTEGGSELVRLSGALAVLGSFATRQRITEVAGIDEYLVAIGMEKLRHAGLLRDARLRDSALEQAVLAAVPRTERTRWHRATAELLYREGAPTLRIAQHLIEIDTTQPPWAINVLLDAADRALHQNDPVRAGALLGLAERNCQHTPECAAARNRLALAQWRVDPAIAYRRIATCQVKSADETYFMARNALWQGNLEQARKLVSTADIPSDSERWCALWLTCEWLYGAHRTRSVFPEQLTTGVSIVSDASEGTATTFEHRLHAYGLTDHTVEPLAQAVSELFIRGKTARAQHWCATLLAEATERRAPTWQAILSGVGAEIALRTGDLAESMAQADAASHRISTAGWGALIAAPLCTSIRISTLEGRAEDGRILLARDVPSGMFHTLGGLRYLLARGNHRLAFDRVPAALADFHTCGRLAIAWRVDDPDAFAWRRDLARAYARLGDEHRARAWAEDAAEHAAHAAAHTRAGVLRTLAAVRPEGHRIDLLRRAAASSREAGDSIELRYALADLSQAHYTRGEYGIARMFTRHASELWRRTRRGLPTSTINPPGERRGPGLTAAEYRVATLAAMGHTNRAIADRLCITGSTVEQHLTRTYRKLDVSRRDQLANTLPVELSMVEDRTT